MLLGGAEMAAQSGAHPNTWACASAFLSIVLPIKGSKPQLYFFQQFSPLKPHLILSTLCIPPFLS